MSALVEHFASKYPDQKFEIQMSGGKTFVVFRSAIYYLDTDLVEFLRSPHFATRSFEVCYETLKEKNHLKCINV